MSTSHKPRRWAQVAQEPKPTPITKPVDKIDKIDEFIKSKIHKLLIFYLVI